MSVADAQPDFTAWRQKNVLRPVLRMPLNVSSPSSPAALNAPLESSSTCTTSSCVSALPIPSLNGTKRAAADVAVPTTATAEAEDVVPLMPNNAKPAALQEASLSGSISVTASEQLVLERLRLLEEEHAALRSSLRERMQRTASQSLPVPRDTPPLTTAPAAAAALSSASSRVTASSSRSSAAEEEGTAQEKYAATANKQSISPSVHASEDPTLRTQRSPSTDSLTRHEQRAEQERAAPRFTAAVAELQSSPPARRPADPATLSLPLPQVEAVPQQQQQQQQQHHDYFKLALDQLRHDVQFCASEIERLVEDQYDIRCSVRDALIGMSHRSDSALLPAASAPAMTRDDAAAAASATEEKKAVEGMQHHNDDSGGSRSSRSCDAAGDPTFSPVSSSPPAWLLPWLQQLKAEQGDHFQRLREEMVVLVCHAVAEMRHTSALVASDVQGNGQGRRSRSSSSAVQPEQQQLPVAKAGRHPSANTVVEMDPAALRQPGRNAEEPPPSLLWQRYRRLMSPTPPSRSVALSASASVAPSEAPPAFSVAAQDALWSAVLQMQRVMESQSAQIAILTERVCAAAPQITASKQQQHREPSPDDSAMSSDTLSTTFSSSPSHDSPLPSKQRHHYLDDTQQHQQHQQQRPRSSRRSHHHHRQHQQHQKQQRVSGTSEFAELQTEMKDLRHLLRTTLERRDALPIPATAAQSEAARHHHHYLRDGDASSIDSDRRSSTYARRRYVDAAAPPPPQPSAAPPVAAGRSLRAEDTRYARGVTSVGRQQQQQQNTPNVRLPSWQRDTPSPLASPIPAEWRDEYGNQADAAPETHTTPPELPRRRVRTVLTSSLVYPPA